jgi:hypothetical protein
MHRMNCRRREAKTEAPDDPTVWVGTPSVYPMLSLNQDREAPRWILQHWMNWHLGHEEASVYPTVAWKLLEIFWPRGLQHRMNWRTVGVMHRSSCISGSSTAKWHGGHRINRRLEKAKQLFIRRYLFQWSLANGSLDALGYLYPSTHPFEVARLCGSVEEFKTPRRSYPIHQSA